MKICRDCKIKLPYNRFSKDNSVSDGYRNQCKSCTSYYRKKLYTTSTRRKRHLKLKFNITLEGYQKLHKTFKGKCGICRKPETSLHLGGVVRHLAVDHCHKTGRIRGLLCNKCNRSLGALGDSIKTIIRVLKYLKGSI